MLPSTLTGWIVFYVFLLALTIVIAWIVSGKTPPAELTAFVSLVVTGFLALVRGESEMPKDSKITTESTTTVETPKEDA